MKTTDRKLAYSVVIVLAVIAAEVAWFLFVGPANRNPYYATECESNCDIPWWASPEFWTAAFTAALTGSTILLWWVTRNTWVHAQESSERQLRAYVFINEAKRRTGHGTDMTFKFLIKNTGATPAYNVTVRVGSEFGLCTDDMVPALPPGILESALGPGETSTTTYKPAVPLTAEQLHEIEAGAHALYIHVAISYVDAFGQKRETVAMVAYVQDSIGDGFLALCDTGNHAN